MPITGAAALPHPPIILPEVGRGEEKKIITTSAAYDRIASQLAALEPETVIISSPHAQMYRDYFQISSVPRLTGSMSKFGAPHISFDEECDLELARAISHLADKLSFPAGMRVRMSAELDHGTMVPLYFIRKYLKNSMIIRISPSGLPFSDHFSLGRIIRQASDIIGRQCVFVASGDLSHKATDQSPYGCVPEGREYDEKIMLIMETAKLDVLPRFEESFCEKAAECGHRSFCIMAGALDGYEIASHCPSLEETFGIGYGCCAFEIIGSGENTRAYYAAESDAGSISPDPYVRLAKETISSYTAFGTLPHVTDSLPAEMTESRSGVFVSIHKNGRLRGCIGTISATTGSIAEEIIQNAVSACSRDPRFSPVRTEELSDLKISVDVLTRAEPVSSVDELDAARYGVIVSKGSRRGLLLPDLDGVDTPQQQIAIAKQKAGIGAAEEEVKLEKFEVIRHE